MLNRSPQPRTPSKDEIQQSIDFCVKHIKAHTESENKRMVEVEENIKKELELKLSKMK